MAILLAAIVLVMLLLRVDVLRPQPAAATPAPAEPEGMTEQWGLFSETFIRDRLRALADELERLDREPDVFARAFHTMVARAAYEALLADAAAVADRPWWGVGEVLDVEAMAPSTGPREVLEF